MLDFYPMDGETQVGFVEVPTEFEQWLIAVSGISFEDVSLNVLGEEDGQVELIMDYDDYMNLCDLYYEYDTLGWLVLGDPEYVDEINAIPDYDAETFASTDWDEASWAEGFVDDLYAGDADENMYLDLYVKWASGPQSPTYVSDGLWDTVYEWWHSMSDGEKEAVIDEGIFTHYYNDALESYGDYEPEPYYDAEDFIEWNYTAEGSNCFICGRLWRPGDYEGHDNICITCADKWEYEEGGPEGEGYYRHAETFEAPYAGLGALFNFGDNPSALGGFTAKELTESSAIHGDFDSASLNYSGKQNLEVRQAEDKCKCNRGDWFRSNCWECYECGEHSTKKECWACSHTTTTNGEWKDGLCWECTDCGEHHTKDRTSHAAETFEASADDYGDVEYIILELLTDAQLEEEYGEVMDDYGIGRDDLPQRLEDDYRTSDEAEYLREKYLKEAETFDAHARYNIHRFTPTNNPRKKISQTRQKLKKQMWTDTTASVGVKGIAAIIAASAIGIYYWKQK